MKLAATFLVSLALAPAFAQDTQPLTGSAEIHWRQFTGTLEGAQRTLVYLGTPRRSFRQSPPAEPTIEIDDFEFYREPRLLAADLAAKLTRLVADPQSFRDYRGLKLCGGFHPDLCIEWRYEQDGQHWHKRAFACLGCDEWRLIDATSAVHTDMTKAAADELRGILRELRTVDGKQ